MVFVDVFNKMKRLLNINFQYFQEWGSFVPIILSFSMVLALPHVTWAMRVKTGSYVGNGMDNRNIPGVGFQPDLVMITASSQQSVFRSNTFVGDATLTFDDTGGAMLLDHIQVLQADGFQVGTNARVNASGTTYYYVAFKKAVGEFNTGTYTGNGSDNRSITGVGFQPDFVFLRGEAASGQDSIGRSSTVVGDLSFKMSSPTINPNYIQALEPDGFQIGNSSQVNKSGRTYHWVAWKTKPNNFNVGSYTGNSIDNRDVSGVGFQPQVVIVANSNSGTYRPVLHTNFMANDESYHLNASALLANQVQLLQVNGFQVGTGAGVNTNLVTYHWMAWQDESPPSTLVKQVWLPGGTAPLAMTNGVLTSTLVPTGTTLVFLIYVKNSTTSTMTDVRMQDILDISASGFSYIASSLVRTSAASPPADTASDLNIFNATAPGTGTTLTDSVNGDVASVCDSSAGACPGTNLNRVTVGNTTGLVPSQANGTLSVPANSTFAMRFQAVKQ